MIKNVNNYLYQEGIINKDEISNTFKIKYKIKVMHMLIIPMINPDFPRLSFCFKLNPPKIIEIIPNITDIIIKGKNIIDKIANTNEAIPKPLPERISLLSSTLKSPPIFVIIA